MLQFVRRRGRSNFAGSVGSVCLLWPWQAAARHLGLSAVGQFCSPEGGGVPHYSLACQQESLRLVIYGRTSSTDMESDAPILQLVASTLAHVFRHVHFWYKVVLVISVP